VADARGITISSADLESEYERSLRTIANPTGLTEIDEFDRIAAEGMLSAILAERNISRAEYLLSMRRNALLRKICEADMAPSDAEIEQQYLREHGEKVRIRRIVVSTSEEAMHILRQMGHGLSFEDLARRFNTSPSAAARDGLMPPFTTAHDEVPAELRATAFTTPVLEMTAPFEVDGSFYIIQVEEKTPADEVPITSVRGELITHWKERMLPGRMQALHKRLHSQSEVTIVDPTLRRAFRERSETMP
jgi:parvulin-like peptidyl-prolyl isomerase